MADQKNKSQQPLSGTIIDYVAWRGDLTFEHSPWCEIDSVIASMISYANFGENELVFGSGKTLALSDLTDSDILERYPQEGIGDGAEVRTRFLYDLAQSVRFRDITVLDQVNDVDMSRDIQFSAMTMDVPGVGIVVAFRGTDPSLVGWKEDFMMSYVTPVPAQSAALDYLKKAADHTSGPLYLTGHSKGGNLALYSAAHAPAAIQERLVQIDSFDGPGLDDETIASDGYRRVEPLIRSCVPCDSVVGLLMNYYPGYNVVQSDGHSIMQHDPFTWKVVGTHFLSEENVSTSSQILDQTVHEWLKSCTPQQRETFVTVVFAMLGRLQSPGAVAEEDVLLKKADGDSRKMIWSLLSRLISIHAEISWNTNVLRPLMLATDDLRIRLREFQGDLVKSEVVQIDNHGNGFHEAVDATMRMAQDGGLNRSESLRMTLCTEEILSMASIISGDMKASFWVERLGSQYELHVSTRTRLDRSLRRRMKRVLTSAPSEKPTGFLAKLSSAFERAMSSDTDQICFSLPSHQDRVASGEWDGYERSILFRLADGVQISIVGGEVRMVVRREFANA